MVEERFEFRSSTKNNLLKFIVAGLVLSVIGVVLMNLGGAHAEHEAVAEGHHGFAWYKRLYTNIWINNVYFTGVAVVGVFFFALQYVAQAGWSVGIKRIAMSFGSWLPIAGILMLVSFLAFSHDIFHWTHHSLYEQGPDYDAIIDGKSGFFFWPLHAGGFPLFFILRMVAFFGLWYWLFRILQKYMLAEDIEGGTQYWYTMRKYSAIFLVIFAVSSSIAAWDWVMSIDTHWFSTMFGWYMFASWWVTTLALIGFITILLKDAGYLSIVNSNHLHDLGKFIFAFSIFWTYIWFSQFLLIYYANIPEETVYFFERWQGGHYTPLFFFNLIINFLLPFLLLMTRDSKRHSRFLKVVAPIVIVGHWLDFYLMITPGVLKDNGNYGLLELGLFMTYAGAFIFVVLRQLSKAPLFAKNHPMLEESIHHHV